MIITLKDIYTGKLNRYRVSLTTDHSASHYGQPVMVFRRDGHIVDIFNWLLGTGRVAKFESPEERVQYEKWIRSFPPAGTVVGE